MSPPTVAAGAPPPLYPPQAGGTSVMQQLLPMMAMQSLMGGDKAAGKPPGASLHQWLLLDLATRALPVAGGLVARWLHARLRSRNNKLYDLVAGANGPAHLRKKGSLLLERCMDSGVPSTAMDDLFDAVLAYTSDLPQTKFIRRLPNGMFVVETNEDIPVGDGVFFRRVPQTSNEKAMFVEVFSFEKDIVQLRDFVNGIETQYRTQRDNQLGRALYYFD